MSFELVGGLRNQIFWVEINNTGLHCPTLLTVCTYCTVLQNDSKKPSMYPLRIFVEHSLPKIVTFYGRCTHFTFSLNLFTINVRVYN